MLNPERNVRIDIAHKDTGILVLAQDEHNYPGKKTVIYPMQAEGSTPVEARHDATIQEDKAERRAVAGGLVTTATVLTGGALVYSGVRNFDATQIVAGLGLFTAGFETGKYTAGAHRRRTVAGMVRRDLTRRYNLPEGPGPK